MRNSFIITVEEWVIYHFLCKPFLWKYNRQKGQPVRFEYKCKVKSSPKRGGPGGTKRNQSKSYG